HSDIRPQKIHAKSLSERTDGVLRCAVNISGGINPVTRDRTKINDVPLLGGKHLRKKRVRGVEEPLHIRIDHGVPICGIAVLKSPPPQRQTSVVQEDIDGFKRGRILLEQRFHGFTIADIAFEGVNPNLMLGGELLSKLVQAVFSTGSQYQVMPRRSE